jgi:8-oxo-dGTP diphosphatase
MTEATEESARLTADVVLFGEEGDGELFVLVIRRRWDPFEGYWALPGGHVDAGEEVAHAAHRELAEETGVRLGVLWLAGVYADPGRDPRGRYVTFAYTQRLRDCPQPTAGDDAADAGWFPVREVLAVAFPLAFDHAQIIRDALMVTPLHHI